MASTSRCPRPGRSPWGPKPPHDRVRMLGWPTSEGLGVGYPGGATPGDSRVREVWPREGEGHGGRGGGGGQVSGPAGFHSLLPPFSVLTLPPLPCSALHPRTRPLGFPVREDMTEGRGVGKTREANGRLPLRFKAGLGRWTSRAGGPRRTDSRPGMASGVAGTGSLRKLRGDEKMRTLWLSMPSPSLKRPPVGGRDRCCLGEDRGREPRSEGLATGG